MSTSKFVKPSAIHEQLLVGYLWAMPAKYTKMRSHKIVNSTFTNKRWRYFYFLGKEMFDNGIREFDDKTVYSYLLSKPKSNKKNWISEYEDFGGFDVMALLIDECKNDSKNEEYHLQEVQKYEVLRKFAEESMIDTENQQLTDNLCKMTLQQVKSYFNHKFSSIFSNVNHGEVLEYNLLDKDLIDDVIDEMNRGEVMGLPLHKSPRLNRKIKGWKRGLTYLVLASGVGKTSFGFEKFILSLIENGKKGLIFANEENERRFVRLMLATVASRITGKAINRERMTEGNFDEVTKEKLYMARDWIIQNQPDLLKFYYLKKYRLEDIIARIEMMRPLGYEYCFIDTFKPDQNSGESARWELFSKNAHDLHDAIKEDSNDMSTLATVQLKIGKEYRFLDLSVIGKSGEISEVASLVLAGRMMYRDEYPGGKYELRPYNYKKSELSGRYDKVPYPINKEKEYMILFIPKNREGGKDEQILYEVNYGLNSWNEVAYVNVPNTLNSR